MNVGAAILNSSIKDAQNGTQIPSEIIHNRSFGLDRQQRDFSNPLPVWLVASCHFVL